jgi:sortase family protein
VPLLVVAGLTLGSVVVLDAVATRAAPAAPSAARGTVAPRPAATATAAAVRPVSSGSAQRVGTTTRPTAVRIPAIGVRAGVERLRLDPAGRLRSPRDPSRAGWWAGGPVPGDLGAAVVAGHLDSLTGPALFWRLSQLGPGDVVRVARSDGRSVAFVVDSVRLFAAADFPTAQVYGPTPDRALRLITCGGSFDAQRGHYRDNVVVFATAS